MAFTYTCEHLEDGTVCTRSRIFANPHIKSAAIQYKIDPQVEKFHRTLPDTNETPLHSLPSIANELGFQYVFLKDESLRFGLPSFKPTGASWAVYKALCRKVGLSSDVSIDELRQALAGEAGIELVTCTAGNWGRAVSKMARILGIRARIYVPGFTPKYTQNLIRQEGGKVVYREGESLDEALAAAGEDSKQTGAILVVDVDVEGAGDVPMEWVSDGYHTILQEADRQVVAQTAGRAPDLVTCSVGAGSWAQAVVSHYKTQANQARMIAVEPDQAASLKEALHEGRMVATKTGTTIMNGMNCGTVSGVSWEILRDGVDVATVVTDVEAHRCVLELEQLGINAGPCGAANLAALRRVCEEVDMPGKEKMIVVLFSSEGRREYVIPE